MPDPEVRTDMATKLATRIVAEQPGGPEVLEVREVDVPAPGPGEVKIRVTAIGVNPIDLKQRSGFPYSAPATFPFTPGSELAGVVLEAGDGSGFEPGDEVLAYRVAGAYASEVVVAAEDVFHKPATLPFDQAAGLLLTGVTAVHALEKVGVQAGDVVLVHGASGAVGQTLIQLAVQRGAEVIGTASQVNHAWLRQLGATPVEYGDGLVDRVREAGEPTAAIDLVGTQEAFDVSLALVPKERVTTIVGGPNAEAAGIQKIGGGPGADPGTELRAAARQGLIDQAGAGQLTVRVVRTFPLEEAAEAHRFVGEGHAAGKVILLPGS